MDIILVLMLIGWVVSAVAKQQAGKARQAAGGRRFGQPETPGQTLRPTQAARPRTLQPREEECPIESELRRRGPSILMEGAGSEGTEARLPDRHEMIRTPLERKSLVLEREGFEGFGDARPRPSERADEEPARTEASPVSVPGLNLRLDAESVVAGVVYAEILGRNRHRAALHRAGGRV